MKEFTIRGAESGQRFSRYLTKLLPQAGNAFINKMLRKKNITLNDGKAQGSETLHEGDIVKVFFSDETFAKMSADGTADTDSAAAARVPVFALRKIDEEQIVYEDDNLIAVFKPVGVLSQKDASGLTSINEQMLQYMADRGDLTAESLRSFKPGICNRLDRNTAGILWFAKTAAGSRGMAEALRKRLFEKYYFAIVLGNMTKSVESELYLTKDEERNIVTVTQTPMSPDSAPVRTGIAPVISNGRVSLVRVRLDTGKSHQIRSVMQFLGFPVLGDPKYLADDATAIARYRTKYHLHGQQLFAYAYAFPKEVPNGLEDLADEIITGIVPETFEEIVRGEFPLKEEGVYGYLEIPRSAGLPV